MRSRTSMLLTMTALTLGTALAQAAESIKGAGELTCKGDPGHVLVVQKVTCSGSATGQSARFDGGQQTWVEADDLVKGSGDDPRLRISKVQGWKHGGHKLLRGQVTKMIDGESPSGWPRDVGADARHRQPGECSAKRHVDGQTYIGDRIRHGLGGHADRGQQTVRLGRAAPKIDDW
jgi:hypothetical protein